MDFLMISNDYNEQLGRDMKPVFEQQTQQTKRRPEVLKRASANLPFYFLPATSFVNVSVKMFHTRSDGVRYLY